MPRRALASLAAVFTLLLSTACSSNNTVTGPTATMSVGGSMSSRVLASVQPAVVPVVPAPPFVGTGGGNGCPHNPPFTSSFMLVINPGTNLSVDQVTFHFLDGSNISSQPIVFGRENINASFPGQFPFTVPFGCGFGRPQTIVADITGFIGTMPFAITTSAPMH